MSFCALSIKHKYGADMYAFSNRELVYNFLEKWVEKYWDELGDGTTYETVDCGEYENSKIDYYFCNHPDESFDEGKIVVDEILTPQ